MDRPRKIVCVLQTSEGIPFPVPLTISVQGNLVESKTPYTAYRQDVEDSLTIYGMKNHSTLIKKSMVSNSKWIFHNKDPIIILLAEGSLEQITYHKVDLIEYP